MSETTKIEAALAPDQWSAIRKYEVDELVARAGPASYFGPAAVAAAALDGAGPDGGPMFTREHVAGLLAVAGYLERVAPREITVTGFRELAARLESLLPPEEP